LVKTLLSDENAVQVLTQLGLTFLEARIYLALCEHGKLTAKELSNSTKKSRPDIYRVIAKLQRKGLVEKIIEKPAQFRAVPIDTGIVFLLERKKAEHVDLRVKTKLLLHEFKEKKVKTPLETESSHFVMIPQKEAVVKRIREAIEKSKKSVDIFLSWRRFAMGITSTFAESAQKAWDREVKFRIIVESPTERAGLELARQFCKKSPFCNIRFVSGAPKTVLGIYDRKKVFIVVDPEKGLFDSPALWSNNRSLVSAIQDYFEVLWLTSMEKPLTLEFAI
jgi:sugar-specific transcriptional regulator TrmB